MQTNPSFLLVIAAACTFASVPPILPAQDDGTAQSETEKPKEAPRGYDRRATDVFVGYYGAAENWSLKALVLMSLGPHWHPSGSDIVVQALTGKDPRLHAYGIEALKQTRDDVLRGIATPELVEALVKKALVRKNEKYREAVLAVLDRVAPEVKTDNRRKWESWWNMKKATYTPATWPPIEKPKERGDRRTTTEPLIERAFDLKNNGLDLVICIDSTGSMQRTIFQARDAMNDVVSLLGGIAPKFRVGLVHYRDHGDMSNGAKMLVGLTKNAKKVRDRLNKLVAGGGGDIPELVENGLQVALSKQMGWNKTANKLVLLIGDAPPQRQATALERVKAAHEDPANHEKKGRRKRPTTGGAKQPTEVRPFVTSAIATHKQAAVWFKEIAEAGGGAFVALFEGEGGSLRRGERPVNKIVLHVLSLSFGARWQKQLKPFVEVYFDWRGAKLFD